MKVFIVFSGIVLMCVSCMVYQADANWYSHNVTMMKAIAEEAACQAALCIDEEEYGRGIYCFDYEQARQYAEEYIIHAQQGIKAELVQDITCEMTFEDDLRGYSPKAEGKPSVSVRLTAHTTNMFRLPLLKKDSLTAFSRYEINNFAQGD